MKFKYYMRGAGIGIIAATAVLSAAFLFQDNISDAEVIQRAMELGMVMEEGTPQTLGELSKQNGAQQNTLPGNADRNAAAASQAPDTKDGTESNNHASGQDTSIDKDTDKDTDTSADTDTDIDVDTAIDVDTDVDKNTDSKKNHAKGSSSNKSEKITVTIVGGDVSRTVSAKVFEAGLVDSADEFNDYLGSHDYDNALQPGTYEVEMGASFKEIAEILTKK